MTQQDKLRGAKQRFKSLRTLMTQPDKFRDAKIVF